MNSLTFECQSHINSLRAPKRDAAFPAAYEEVADGHRGIQVRALFVTEYADTIKRALQSECFCTRIYSLRPAVCASRLRSREDRLQACDHQARAAPMITLVIACNA
jgi:hypothetical protein